MCSPLRKRHQRLRTLSCVAVLLLAAPAWAQDGAEGEFAPSFGAEDEAAGDFAPTFDDEDEAAGDFAPTFDDEDEAAGDFAPTFDDEDEAAGDFAPTFDDEDEAAGDFAPTFDDEEEATGDFAPTFDDEEEAAGGFAPAYDDEEEAAGDFAPTFDDEDEAAGDFAPTFDDEGEAAGDFAPTFDDEDEAAVEADEDEYDDAYYEQMWEALEDDEETVVVDESDVSEDIEEGTGRIEGVVIDGEFDQPLGGARVEIVETGDEVETGPTGYFFFELVPGLYTVRFSSFGFEPQAYQMEVVEGEITAFEDGIEMGEDRDAAMTVEVEGRMDRDSAAAQLVQRQQAATTRDSISAEQISRTGDSAAADAARRVVGVTLLEDRYAVIRGLQGRYNQVYLNGLPVAILNPTYPAVELDLFPSSLLSSMAVYKVPTASLTGDFTGGLLEIATGDYAEDFEMSLSVGTSFDFATVFQDFDTSRGGALDWLGFDDGTRAYPDSFGGFRDLIPAGFGQDGLSQSDINEIGRDLEPNWGTSTRAGLPGLSLNFGLSDTVEFEGERALSYRFNLYYKNNPRRRENVVGAFLDPSNPPFQQDREVFSTEVLWGAMGSLRYDINDDNELSLVLLTNALSDDRVEWITGTNVEDVFTRRRELTYSSQRATTAQLTGEHRDLLDVSELSWAFGVTQGRNNMPDHRFAAVRLLPNTTEFSLSPQSGSAERYWQDLNMLDYSGRVDWDFEIGDQFYRRVISVGGLVRRSEQDYEARRFRFRRRGGVSGEEFFDTPENLLTPDNIGTLFDFIEETLPTDAYRLDQLQLAGYLQADVRINDLFRITAGARVENFDQAVDSNESETRRTDFDVLPSASLVFNPREDMAIRAAYGASVARPQALEFAPTVLQDYQRGRQLIGNPDLERTFIHNMDLRWELYPSPSEIISATLFYKQFNNHIERVIVQTNGSLETQNIEDARDFGIELEFQLELERFSDALRGFSLATNFSYIFSEVQLSNEEENLFTSNERPMADQSPFIFNLLASYEHEESGWNVNLVYNAIGRTLTEAGALGVPDVYRSTIHSLDINANWEIDEHWSLKLSLSDLVPTDIRYDVGDFTRDVIARSPAFGVGFGWRY